MLLPQQEQSFAADDQQQYYADDQQPQYDQQYQEAYSPDNLAPVQEENYAENDALAQEIIDEAEITRQ